MLRSRILAADKVSLDHELGVVTLDGDTLKISPDDHVMRNILEKPLWLIDGDLYAKDDPEKFIKSLYLHYKSAYFRATKAEDDGLPPTKSAGPLP